MFYAIWTDILQAPEIQLDKLFQYLLNIVNILQKCALYILHYVT